MPTAVAKPAKHMPMGVYALTAGAFGIGTTEFVIMGLLMQVATDLKVSIASAGLLISGYALGVFAGAPLLTAATVRLPRKVVLVALMVVFTLGNLACALAPNYELLLAARVLTSLAHGTFFGVGAVVATLLVDKERKASALSVMFTGLTVATLLGVPAGAWLGLHHGWRATFWAVAAIGVVATIVTAVLVPKSASVPATSLGQELRVVTRRPVLLGLLMTTLGFGGMFTVYTFIQPLLTQVSGFADAAVSPILLLFGAGMIVGNLVGGRLADRDLSRALLITLFALAATMALMRFALPSKPVMAVFVGLLGAAAFATGAPLQTWVLRKAGDAQSLASSLNIGAFNLGNAFGAWLGSAALAHGAPLPALTWIGALVPASAFVVAWYATRQEREPCESIALPDCSEPT